MSIAVVDTNYCYQAAAHLNNVGISLLLRDDFVNATLTLSDAIQVIKMTSSAKGEYLSSSAVQQKLKKASRRLLYPSSASTSNLPIFRIVSEDESPRALHASTQTPCLINMDSVQVEGIPSEQDLAILSSVIFYHHGVSYRYLASTRQDDSTQNFERGALQMFKLSLRIAALHRGRIHTILALRNIVDLGKVLGLHHKEQQEYESRLRYETYSVEAMERRKWAPKRTRPAPAA